jgi:hypothetical protein
MRIDIKGAVETALDCYQEGLHEFEKINKEWPFLDRITLTEEEIKAQFELKKSNIFFVGPRNEKGFADGFGLMVFYFPDRWRISIKGLFKDGKPVSGSRYEKNTFTGIFDNDGLPFKGIWKEEEKTFIGVFDFIEEYRRSFSVGKLCLNNGEYFLGVVDGYFNPLEGKKFDKTGKVLGEWVEGKEMTVDFVVKEFLEKNQELSENERKFAEKVIRFYHGCSKDNGIVLWDIDDTIGCIDYLMSYEWRFRNSFYPLVDFLRAKFPNVKNGILSSRKPEDISSIIELMDRVKFFETDLVFSSFKGYEGRLSMDDDSLKDTDNKIVKLCRKISKNISRPMRDKINIILFLQKTRGIVIGLIDDLHDVEEFLGNFGLCVGDCRPWKKA